MRTRNTNNKNNKRHCILLCSNNNSNNNNNATILSSCPTTKVLQQIKIICFFVLLFLVVTIEGRPVVRNIQSAHEFDRLLEKHATETGLPVIVDYYSDSCGPCRMMAPIFKKVAMEYVDKAVFVKVDTNSQHELSNRYHIRSLPTFQYFVDGIKVDEAVGGIGEGALRQQTDRTIRSAELDNVYITMDQLMEYYNTNDPTKTEQDVTNVYKKCVDLITNRKLKSKNMCIGTAANKLSRKLKKKYGTAPKLIPRFTNENKKSSSSSSSGGGSKDDSNKKKTKEKTTSDSSNKPKLHLASIDELKAELEKRLDEERDRIVELEDTDEEEYDTDFHKHYVKSSYPERMIIVGGGPAGLSAAIYGARAGLQPLVIAPSMGGQLQGKGVDVENYPGLNTTGPAVVALMKRQAAHFGAIFEDDVVVEVIVPTSSSSSSDDDDNNNNNNEYKPIQIKTNNTGIIETHTLIVATGAESNWLGIKGEYELRGGGVSSCAICDGFLYTGKDVIVVGGGDAAMEDALVLARTSKTVTIVHRRDKFRASKILSDRIMNYHEPNKVRIVWNTTVKEIVGKQVDPTTTTTTSRRKAKKNDNDVDTNNDDDMDDEDDDNTVVDMDDIKMVVKKVVLEDVVTGEISTINCDAVFVAIGHTPNTKFLDGVVRYNPNHPGYIYTVPGSTHTSVRGIFAAGDVADATYRQAITSAGSGAAAALDAERYLSEHALGNEAADLEAELLAELFMADGTASGTSEGASEATYNIYEESGGRMKGMKESLTMTAASSSSGEL